MEDMEIVILSSARRHEVADEDMIHVYRQPLVRTYDENDDEVEIAVGLDTKGRLLEIGFQRGENVVFIIHAMHTTRPKYLR